MKIDNVVISRSSEWDGLPIKNKLPEELKARLKTENQWLDEGFAIKPGATPYKMHPSALSKKTIMYYLDIDVQLS